LEYNEDDLHHVSGVTLLDSHTGMPWTPTQITTTKSEEKKEEDDDDDEKIQSGYTAEAFIAIFDTDKKEYLKSPLPTSSNSSSNSRPTSLIRSLSKGDMKKNSPRDRTESLGFAKDSPHTREVRSQTVTARHDIAKHEPGLKHAATQGNFPVSPVPLSPSKERKQSFVLPPKKSYAEMVVNRTKDVKEAEENFELVKAMIPEEVPTELHSSSTLRMTFPILLHSTYL